ncbi:STIMATE family protein [Aspergillus novofumigatus IBT 16806]|uniref:Vacuolar membrane protein n=1 Tax=Aspergillus novofumigatus (strain IBT 16806) TaxID=1392255 RepID=A0A2I1CLN0_ASPN1|nr:uncharacterized protein P174DRAFT_436951 [Aspergillus novofumigatus IBT 16806]PKX98523.1 hypothetical protein P174DRAFT_436951 [Aspergillus novofumigatus IBT 16806]
MCLPSMTSLAAAATAIAVMSSGAPTSSPTPSIPVPSSMAGPHHDSDGEDNGECRLLGPFSILVQAALGSLALLSLVYKRWRERPQRPVKVWAFDVSKQVFGSAMLHLANLLMSMFSAGQFEITSKYRPNPCSFYLLNLGIDTTLGIPILIFILHILNRLAAYTPLANPPESIESGNYGAPPRAAWWFKQAMIYFFGLLGMKICVFFLIQLLPFIVKIGDWALRWTEGNTALQIIFVMLLFPVIMNAIQYYIIDTFIKKPLSQTHELLQEEDEVEDALLDDGRTPRNALLSNVNDADTFGPDEGIMGKDLGRNLEPPARLNGFGHAEYDPAVDGEYFSPASSASASSSSSHGEYDAMSSSTKLTLQNKRS